VRTVVPLCIILVAVMLSSLLTGCAPKREDVLVASIGKTPVTIADYEKLYVKSSGGNDSGATATQEDREKFLDLMVKYRKKLIDAYDQGMDRRPELMGEIQQYKGSLAASYLTDRQLVTPAVKKMYDRSREEIRASHILLTFKENATHEDSAVVLKQAADLIAEAKAGKNFSELAVSYSQDPSVKNNQGDLYYFTVGRMVPEFEEAAFALKKGEISSPVSTRFGAHILKVTDRQTSKGETHCSHIMIRFQSQTPTPEDTLAAFEKTRMLQDSVKAGIDFAELAKHHSDDVGSADRGGDLGWFSRGRWPQPFDEAAMILKPGEYSSIIRTVYGYHLIYCLETRPPKTFDEARQELQNLYQQQRFQGEYATYLDGIRKEVQYVRNDSIALAFTTAFDSTKTVRDSGWADVLTPSLRHAAMFRFSNGAVSVDSVLSIIKSHLEWSNLSLHRVSLSSTLDKVAEQLVFSAKADILEKQDPEFAGLLREYKEGILLYQAEQENVWNRIATNDSLLRIYFNKNRDAYTYPDRVLFSEIRATTEAQAKLIHERVLAGKTFEQFAFEDSVRMKLPSSYVITFASGKSTINTTAQRVLDEVAAVHAREPELRISLIASPDTSIRKTRNTGLATQRLEAVKKLLSTKARIAAETIVTEQRPQRFAAAKVKDSTGVTNRVEVQVLGRQALVLSRIEQHLLAPSADERARRADSLAIGGVSGAFPFKVGYSIVRLDGRESARQKTFEEAGAEVSSHFQDSEAKRLEKEWMDGVAQKHPVILHKENLKQAFAPLKK
jgi:peptidyl-prolyl cis-trans isomerase SurA